MKARTKYIIILFSDICAVLSSVLGGFIVRFGLVQGIEYAIKFWWVFIIVLPIRLIFYKYAGLYSLIWRYASLRELISVVRAVTYSSFVIVLFFFLLKIVHFPNSILIIDYLLNITLIGGSRLSYRFYKELIKYPGPNKSIKRMLIVGAGDSGVNLARQMEKQSHYTLIGFVDDDINKVGHKVSDISILGTLEKLSEIVIDNDIDEIIISIPSATSSQMRRIVGLCEHSTASFKTIPALNEIIDGRISLSQIREVRIEDLLGRDPVELDLKQISEYVTGERVLVTGAGGSIGSELCRQIANFNPAQLIMLGHGENSIYLIDQEMGKKYPYLKRNNVIADVRNANKIDKIFERYRPTVVFHAAAHKHVPLMEENPDEAVVNNVIGTRNLTKSASEHNAKKFVMISTDKAVNPTNIMGATKRVAEMIVLAHAGKSNTQYAVVRFGNVLGSRGSVVPLFKRQIAEGGPVTVTHPDVTRYFMTIKEAVQLVIQAGSMASGGEKFILDMGEPVKVTDLARDMIRLSGLEEGVDIDIKFVGLRPGEKLYEELFNSHEKTSTTDNNKIFIAKPEGIDEKKLNKVVNNLLPLANNMEFDEIKKNMALIVESYNY